MVLAGDNNLRVVNPKVRRVPPKKVFIVKNSGASNVAYFDDVGNLVLKGTLTSGGVCSAPSGSFIVKNSGGDTVAYIDTDGDMCIEGSCSDECASCNPPSDAFIIKNSSGTNVGYIDYDGDLCLKGELCETGYP